MRIGSLARSQGTLAALFVAAATTAMLPLATFGQVRNTAYAAGNSPRNQGSMQALYDAPNDGGSTQAASRYRDANGNQMVVPAGYNMSCGQGCDDNGGCYGGGCDCGGCGYGGCGGCGGCGDCGPGCQGGYPGCCPMGAGGTNPPIGYDLMNDAGIEGNLVDQRGPHYFDIRAEAVYLQRDKSFEKNIDFSSRNVGNVAGTNVVLSSSQLDIEDPQYGFRVVGRYDICPMSVVEFGYMGIFDWNDRATTDPADHSNDLYSLFSRVNPESGPFAQSPTGVTSNTSPINPNLSGPNPFSERASFHSIELSSDLQSAEISYRRYWLGYSPRISGTLLGGFRYTKVNENFTFFTQGSQAYTEPPFSPNQTLPLASLEYKEDCDNNLAGLQIGGDMWVSLFQGVRVGSEVKGGIYDNHSRLFNRISTNPQDVQPPASFEDFRQDHVAFIGEGSFDVVADLFPSVSLRVGYEVLFLNELVLAGNNFNQSSPYGNQIDPRVPFVDTHGELFYHGAHAGLEYTW
jgi:hypothetical protein